MKILFLLLYLSSFLSASIKFTYIDYTYFIVTITLFISFILLIKEDKKNIIFLIYFIFLVSYKIVFLNSNIKLGTIFLSAIFTFVLIGISCIIDKKFNKIKISLLFIMGILLFSFYAWISILKVNKYELYGYKLTKKEKENSIASGALIANEGLFILYKNSKDCKKIDILVKDIFINDYKKINEYNSTKIIFKDAKNIYNDSNWK